MYEDKTLTCRDCGREFVWTASEQAFWAEREFTHEPTRCLECRRNKRAANGNGAPRQLYKVICDACGKETEVTFEPKGTKPVYCRECYNAQRAARY